MSNKTEHDSLAPIALTKGRAEATLAGQTLAGRYDVLELLGVGGMGAVYRARDRELDELVALKVIRRELAALPAMVARFRHEVKLARRVTHVNVARTFELGSVDGELFCTMELIEGESLTQRLEQRRTLSVAEAVSIACAMCEGLAAAHAADVIHRDIKPDNVLLAGDGRVVLADFGVAAVGVSGAGELSGTPVYMAPEQARGEPASPAADVYAVGVVLYEMLTGQRAFVGDAAQILGDKQAFERVAVTPGGDVTPEIAAVIGQATARDKEHRIPTANALRRALQPWAGTARRLTQPHRIVADVAEITTVIVLAPIADPLHDAKLYVAEAVHEQLLARLARLPRVRVLSRAGAATESSTIGVCFDVTDRLQITVTFASGAPLIASFPLVTSQVGVATETIATSISAALAEAQTHDPTQLEAYELLLQARHIANRDFSRMPEAIAMLQRANELAPTDPRIMATLAVASIRTAFFMPAQYPNALKHGQLLANAAVVAAPDLADAHIALGHVELNTGNPISAARHFRVAIARAPHLPEAHEQLGRMLLESGYLDAAVARLEEALAIAPNLRSARWEIARAWALEQRWEEHGRIIAELLAGDIDRPLSRARYAWWRKDWVALAASRKGSARLDRALWPGLVDGLLDVFLVPDGWAKNRELLLTAAYHETPNRRRRVFVSQLASEAAAFGGDIDEAIKLIEHGVANGLFDLHWFKRCPLLDVVREHPSATGLHKRIKERADAILDALYGDSAAALSETAIA